jgi:hypothetical protein
MTRFARPLALVLAAAAAPAAADTVMALKNHADEMSVMGQRTPAQDNVHYYWFSDDATRYDMGDSSVIANLGRKQLYIVNHAEKTYSTIDLPFSFKSLVGPEMAPMMDQMMAMMAPKVTVTESDRTGSFAGYSCQYAQMTMSMAMMQMTSDMCLSEQVPIDYARYKELFEMRGELAPNATWMKEMVEKLDGFPVRSDTTMSMMGNSFKSWQELESVEQKSAPAGHYEAPAGYKEIKYDPMTAQQPPKKKKRGG